MQQWILCTSRSEYKEFDFETKIEEPADCDIISLEEEVQLHSIGKSLNNALCEHMGRFIQWLYIRKPLLEKENRHR